MYKSIVTLYVKGGRGKLDKRFDMSMKNNNRFISIILVLSMLACLFTTSFAVEFTDSLDGENDIGSEIIHKDFIPKASDVEHVHGSVGWNCSQECSIPEHVHTIDACYVRSEELVCGYHEHTEACYNEDGALICGKKSMTAHSHTIDECYELICLIDNSESLQSEHIHALDECYKLVCGEEESDGHEHDDMCYYTLNCDKQEHTHGEDDCEYGWNCETEYVLLTVEYYIAVNGQTVRAANTYQALLTNGDEYKASIDDLRRDGYKIGTVKRYTAGQEDAPEEMTVTEDNGKYSVSGKAEKDTKIIVYYVYQEEYAPYRVDYYGYNAAGKNQELLYSYTGLGKKDSQISASQDEINTQTISISINDLMKNLYDILGDQAALGNSGEAFIKKLIDAVNQRYLTGDEDKKDALYHDITPLIEHIAGVSEEDDAAARANKLNALTRVQIKSYIAEKLVKVYGFDSESQQVWDAKLTVTADELAVRHLYYTPKKPQTVLFVTGLPNAEVIGIPKTPVDAEPDPDNVGLNYDIKLNTNYITSLPTVDIHHYTKNVYGKHQSYVFVGWVTGEDAQAITDYTPANAAGKYKDLTIYTADGDAPGSGDSLIPEGVKTAKLADTLIQMPDGGATYYAVWQPYGAAYTVQVWFESEKGDNTYVESHSLDIQRYNRIGMPVTFNEFDVNRAKEQPVIDAANRASNAIFDDPVSFEDPDSDAADIYRTYADYQNSPFYGFDFLECSVCAADPSYCGSAGCTCGKQRKTNGDGSEGDATSVTACNYQKVSVGENGTTVLNLYYTREIWEIALTPSVSLWTVQALQRANEYRIHVYWTGGQEQSEIKKWLDADKSARELIPGYMDGKVISGKYGTEVDDAHKNGIGWDNIGSAWQERIGDEFQTWTIPAGTDVLLANGSEAFQPRGAYVYPQDTITYIDGTPVEEPKDWVLPFHCLSTIEPEMFTNHTAKRNEDDTDYVTIQNGVSMWQSQRFGEESVYDLSTDTRTYGTHRLEVYPYYHAISDTPELSSHTFNINYYLQALPHEEAATPYVYQTANKDEIKFVKDVKDGEDYTVTLKTPASLLSYSASTPDGFIPLMWRTSPEGFTNYHGGFQGVSLKKSPKETTALKAAWRYTRPQIVQTGMRKYQVPAANLKIDYVRTGTPSGTHNVSFNSDNLVYLGENTAYESDWRQKYTDGHPTQNDASVARMDPGSYWVTDWIRAGAPGKSSVSLDGSLTGENGLYALIERANKGEEEAVALLTQLESSFAVGALFPTGESEKIYYHRYNPDVFRYTTNGTFTSETSLTNTENAVAFARKQYTITYNTCFLNEDGDVLRDEDGIVMAKLHTTQYEMDDNGVITGKGDVVAYDQPLGYDPAKGSAIASFDDYYNNYYDAYFAFDSSKNPMEPGAFTFEGYGSGSGTDASLGGYGRWYLDPDGTIPFNEENLQKMPAGNIDVYYHFNDFRYHIYFVDEISGKDTDPMDVTLNGENVTLNAVVNHQTVMPNTPAENFPEPSDENLYFAGWFYDESGTSPYDFSMEINEDVVVYAVWKPKVPTDYKIRHVLVDQNGREIRELVESEWIESYVGNTIDANALSSEYYEDGLYFKVDDYSQSMVLEAQNEDKTKNILTFYYTYAGARYTIEYKDVNTGIDILPSVTYPTKLSAVTVGMTEIAGWEYVGYSVDKGERVPQKTHTTVRVTDEGVVVTFWYERIPADDEIMALKLIDGVLSDGTWFHFELVDQEGHVVRTAQSVNGLINFDSLGLDAVGTYRYILREVNEEDKYRITHDDTEYEVVVEVTQPVITEPLVCSITYYKDGELYEGTDSSALPVFENKRLPADVQFKAQKYLDGALMSGEGFAFLLQGGKGLLSCGHHIHDDGCYDLRLTCGQTEDEDLPETEDLPGDEENLEGSETPEDKVLSEGEGEEPPQEGHKHTDTCYTKTLICGEEESADHTKHDQSCYSAPNTLIETATASDGAILFDSLSLEETGIYVYNIHERNDGSISYLYDEAEYRVAVEVFINDRNEKDTKVTITRDGEAAQNIRFDNKRVIPVRLALEAQKYVDGALMSGEGFAFLLQGGEGLLGCGQHIHSDDCYELSLICDKEEGEGAEPPQEGHKHTDACYTKTLICGEEESADHTMHDQSCYTAPDTLIETATASDGTIAFRELVFDRPGIYVYSIHERNDGGTSYLYDASAYRVAVEVFFNENYDLDKRITITRDGEVVEAIRFDNKRVIPVEVPLVAQKYLDNALMSGEGFEFLLNGGEGLLTCVRHIHSDDCYEMRLTCGQEENSEGEGTESPQEGHKHTDACYTKTLICGEEESPDHTEHDQSCYTAPDTLIETATAVNGAIVFKTLVFDSPGTYVYSIHERNDGGTSYLYDAAAYRVAVEVFFNDREDLDKRVTITRDGEAVEEIRFDNYTIPTDDPEPSEDPEKPDDSEKPETGDPTNLRLYVLLLWISGLGLAYLFIDKRKLQKK